MVCTGATQLVSAAPKLVAIEVALTAAISETPTTVGVADLGDALLTDEQINETLDALQAMGVQNVRIMIPWAGVQLFGPDSYFRDNVDREVNAAAARNMGVLAGARKRFRGGQGLPPSTGSQTRRSNTRISRARWQNVTRARSRLRNLEGAERKTIPQSGQPAGYTELLKAAYPAIKKADPSAAVIGGVVGPSSTQGRS